MKVVAASLDKVLETSFHGDVILSSINELTLLFGEPYGGDGLKTQYDWRLSYKDIPFTIYDWKEYRDLDLDETIEFHIGARNREESIIITNIVNNILNNGVNS